MSGKSAVVIVDDEPAIVFLLKRDISRHFGERFVYETALGAREALELIDGIVAQGVRVILIVSDWLMPDVGQPF